MTNTTKVIRPPSTPIRTYASVTSHKPRPQPAVDRIPSRHHSSTRRMKLSRSQYRYQPVDPPNTFTRARRAHTGLSHTTCIATNTPRMVHRSNRIFLLALNIRRPAAHVTRHNTGVLEDDAATITIAASKPMYRIT